MITVVTYAPMVTLLGLVASALNVEMRGDVGFLTVLQLAGVRWEFCVGFGWEFIGIYHDLPSDNLLHSEENGQQLRQLVFFLARHLQGGAPSDVSWFMNHIFV